MAERVKMLKWNSMEISPGPRGLGKSNVVAMRQYSWTDENYDVHTNYWFDEWSGWPDNVTQPGGKIISWCEMPAEGSDEWHAADELPEIGQNVIFWEQGNPLPVRNGTGEIIDWTESFKNRRAMQFCGSWGRWNENGNRVLKWHALPDNVSGGQVLYTNDVKRVLNAS